MVTIQNAYLKIEIDEMGAEIQSIQDLTSGYEFLWQADPQFWKRKAPILFPIVGRLQDDQYLYDGKFYSMNRHGFARDCEFTVQNHTEQSASFYLKNNETTYQIYPFEFSLQVNYVLYDHKLTVTFEVYNPSLEKPLYYSVGYHPAFNLEHTIGRNYPEFNQVSYSLKPEGYYYLQQTNQEGLLNNDKAKYMEVIDQKLYHKQFKNDALIYQISEKAEFILRNQANDVEIKFRSIGFDYTALWSTYPKRAPFLAVEAWSGLPDVANEPQLFKDKRGIHCLNPQSICTHDLTIELHKKNKA
ncbi:aldose 1-epimerase family protein [Facklamia miroungae]|uniref:Galactose mutarotase n=1 Tax=Facklamia miroungae TaxID=120956 RepID=A0A1G7PAA0_9LACT|nr:aldose 1-epimerase family protein [Facklamia miroungae]NKZ28614.1 aldose 1-epimerase family protein [Facklamia miroungae]SDF82400.1 Galactose mutarotase [Facklamia miroungae]